MHTTEGTMTMINKKGSLAILGITTLGAVLLTSERAKATCDNTETLFVTTPDQVQSAEDRCSMNGVNSTLEYEVGFTAHSVGGPMSGFGFGSNQIISYQQSGGPNNGYWDGLWLYCANEGWLNTGWQGAFNTIITPPGGGGFPPSQFLFCSNQADAAQEAEGYVWLVGQP